MERHDLFEARNAAGGGPRVRTARPADHVTPTRVAALDVGSNSFHLAVVEVGPDGSLTVRDRVKEMVRLGERTLRDGVIPETTFRRGIAALQTLLQVAGRHRPEAIIAVGTSALREAENGGDFVAAARRELGLDIEIIDGLEEARFIYLGARSALDLDGRRVALFDVGGGSTEAIVGDEDECLFTASLKLGVLRLRDQWPCDRPVALRDLRLMGDWVRTIVGSTVTHLRRVKFDLAAFTSGTALALARVAGRALPDANGCARYELPLEALRAWEQRLAALSARERSGLPGIDERRADTILPGAVILRTILELCDMPSATVCDAALREGVIAEYLARRRAAGP